MAQKISNTDLPKSTGLIVIPARLDSTRLPRKLLLSKTGRPLLAHVIERARHAVTLSRGLLSTTVVAADDERLCALAEQCGARGVMTSANHPNGTSRIAEAVSKVALDKAIDFVVNVQADQPEMAPEAILEVANLLVEHPQDEMATAAVARTTRDEALFIDPNVVKVILSRSRRALYFSRAPIPFEARILMGATALAASTGLWHHHVGLYAYRTPFLLELASRQPVELEMREDLEPLRALDCDAAIRVAVIPSDWASRGVDTAEDYAKFVRRYFEKMAGRDPAAPVGGVPAGRSTDP